MLLAGGIAPGIGGGGVDKDALDKPATSPSALAAGCGLCSSCKLSGLIALTSPSGNLTSQRPTAGSNLMSRPCCPLRLAAACKFLRTTASPGCRLDCGLAMLGDPPSTGPSGWGMPIGCAVTGAAGGGSGVFKPVMTSDSSMNDPDASTAETLPVARIGGASIWTSDFSLRASSARLSSASIRFTVSSSIRTSSTPPPAVPPPNLLSSSKSLKPD
mmetsp:Transcript_13007/g.29529  ORF Transcript_13007/g.29529 Transcript_13007/m.29529 type:complete len:215 (+) Transcript_13007:1372-2016(+)